MKRFGKFLTAILLFSLAAALPAYAAETKSPRKASAPSSGSLLKDLGFPSRAERVTLADLQTALTQESKDQTRYRAFAEKAQEEGRPEDGKIFSALARAKQFYLDYYAESLKTRGSTPEKATETPIVKNTPENFKSAMESELYKGEAMYPDFLAQVPPEGSDEVSNVFKKAKRVTESHASFLQEILATYPSKIPVSAYNVCSVCGYFFLEWAEMDACPICGAPKDKFLEIA